MKFTSQQEKMKDKLEIVCNRIQREILPFQIDEVWGFGSFFRLKDSPRDVDLILKFSKENSIYEKFKEILEKTYSKNSKYQTPKEAFEYISSSELNSSEHATLMPIFSQWIESYTWNILFGGPLSIPEFKINPTEITKRVLLKELRGIQIAYIVSVNDPLESLRAEKIDLVWSDSAPNVSKNLDELFSPTKIRKARLSELENFDKQISSHQQECDVVIYLIKYVRKSKSVKDRDDFKKSLLGKAEGKFTNISKEHLTQVIDNVNRAYPDEQVISATNLVDYTSLDDQHLKDKVENKRIELKKIQKTLFVSRSVLSCLYLRKSREQNEYEKKFSLEELIAMDVLGDIPKKIVSEKEIRENLKMLNFPEERVFERKGRGRYRFEIPEDKNEEKEIIKQNEEIEAQSKYRKIIQPLIKQFNKSIWTSFDFDGKLNPITTKLHFYHSNYSEEEIPENVKKTIEFLKDRGFSIEYKKYGIDGRLKIPLEGCKTNKEIKNRISSYLIK